MSKFLKIIILSFVLVSALALPHFSVVSQEDCETVEECEALWEELQGEIRELEGMIVRTEQEKRTLRNQINLLNSRIRQLELQVRQGGMAKKSLEFQIADTEVAIEKTSLKIEDSKEKLTEILRTVHKEGQKSLIEILLLERTLSGFFNNLMALERLNLRSQEFLGKIKELKINLEEHKERVDKEKENLARTIKVQTLQKQQSEGARREQERLKRMTEAQYQQYLREKQDLERRAAEIMSRIAQLTLPGLDVPRDRRELYELARWAGNTAGGVRPALILGLIEVESALGTNVGQCNCYGQPVCRHPHLTFRQVMRRNQWAAFEAITRELGLDPYRTPVSCFVNGGRVQWGGAMGPAQFMPNTWLHYKKRVEEITGVRPAHPWRARDAFLAAALYLADWGAASQIRHIERGAVLAYLCGTSVMTPRCRQAGGEWFQNLVMRKTDQWQRWIGVQAF